MTSETENFSTAEELQRHQMTLEALADVDAGRVVDHEAIKAWADGLGANEARPIASHE